MSQFLFILIIPNLIENINCYVQHNHPIPIESRQFLLQYNYTTTTQLYLGEEEKYTFTGTVNYYTAHQSEVVFSINLGIWEEDAFQTCKLYI